jgi:hypothetical protein
VPSERGQCLALGTVKRSDAQRAEVATWKALWERLCGTLVLQGGFRVETPGEGWGPRRLWTGIGRRVRRAGRGAAPSSSHGPAPYKPRPCAGLKGGRRVASPAVRHSHDPAGGGRTVARWPPALPAARCWRRPSQLGSPRTPQPNQQDSSAPAGQPLGHR